jgi:S-DNA-T family DNA segregation ATPase FtsK/SpoIIIE
VWLCTVGGSLLVGGLCGLVVLFLWAAGRRAGNVPEFLAPAEERAKRVDDEITSDLAIAAFRDLGIAELRKRIDATPSRAALFATTPHIAGCGMQFDFIPPRGATHSGAILERHNRLAENLLRLPHEVHASVPKSGTIRVWAADSGALDEPIEPSPLVLDEGIKADYRRGSAPFGVGLRSNRVGISLFQKHVLVAGMSAQGKTKTMRALALWLALDPNVELWVADLKGFNDETGVSDWEMFRGIATRFVAGPSDEHVIQTVEMLEDAVTEMKRRLVEGGKGKHKPLICIIDEVQAMYMSPATDAGGRHYGGSKSTSRGLTAVRELHNQGRVTNTLLWEGTQDPSNQNYPVLARNGIHLRISTAISTEPQARMVLQDKAVDAGAAPHMLRLGKDKGTVVVAGDGAPLADDEMFAHVRVHYIDDQAANEIADRAKVRRGPVKEYARDEVRDLLQDVHEAFGEDDRVRAAHMADRLREAHPGYRGYRSINGTTLVAQLAEAGVVVEPGQGRHFPVRADRVLRAMDERDGVFE